LRATGLSLYLDSNAVDPVNLNSASGITQGTLGMNPNIFISFHIHTSLIYKKWFLDTFWSQRKLSKKVPTIVSWCLIFAMLQPPDFCL